MQEGMQGRYEQALLAASSPFRIQLAAWLSGVGPEWSKYYNVFTETLGLTSLEQLDSMDETRIEAVVDLFKESGVKFFSLNTIRAALKQRVEDARCKAKSQKRKSTKPPKGMPLLFAAASDNEDDSAIAPVKRSRQTMIQFSSAVSSS